MAQADTGEYGFLITPETVEFDGSATAEVRVTLEVEGKEGPTESGETWDIQYPEIYHIWCNLTIVDSTSYKTEMIVIAEPNPSEEARELEFNITFNNVVVGTLIVSQDGGTEDDKIAWITTNTGSTSAMTATSITMSHECEAAVGAFYIQTNYPNASVTATTYSDWITISDTQSPNTYTKKIIYDLSENTGDTRNGQIDIVVDNNSSFTAFITQEKFIKKTDVNLPSYTISVFSGNTTDIITMSANYNAVWTVNESIDYLYRYEIIDSSTDDMAKYKYKFSLYLFTQSTTSTATDVKTFTLSADNGDEYVITLKKEPDYIPEELGVFPTSYTFESTGGSFTITATTNYDTTWTVSGLDSSESSWLTVNNPINVTNQQWTIVVRASSNASGTSERTANFYLTDKNGNATYVYVNQLYGETTKQTYVTQTAYTISDAAQTLQIPLNANYNAKWIINSGGDYITNRSSISNNNTTSAILNVDVYENNNTELRIMFISVTADNGDVYTFKVTQNAGTIEYEVLPESISVTCASGSVVFTAYSEISTTWSWTNLSQHIVDMNVVYGGHSDGLHKTLITVTYAENTSEESRTIEILFIGASSQGQYNQKVSILQEGILWAKPSTNLLTFTDKGGISTVSLNSNRDCTWTINKNNSDSWFNFSISNNGSTDVFLSVNCDSNTNDNSRKGELTLINSITNKIQYITIEQSAIKGYILPEKQTIGSEAGSVYVECYGKVGDIWSLSSKPSWVTNVSFDNNGQSQIVKCRISYDTNADGSTRNGVITVLRNNASYYTTTLIQNSIDLSDRRTSIEKDILNFGYKTEEQSIKLTSNYNALWMLSGLTPSWVERVIIENNSTSSAQLKVSVGTNTTSNQREGVFLIKVDNGDIYTISLTQAENTEVLDNVLYNVNTNAVSISPSGGTYSVYMTSNIKNEWDAQGESDTWYSLDIENNGEKNVRLKITANPNTTETENVDSVLVKTKSFQTNILLTQNKHEDVLVPRREKRLYKSKADYTIKKKHVLSNQGDIYESDHMTISPMDELFSDQIPIFSNSNFKFSVRNTSNMQRKHSRGNWLTHNDCETSDNNVWTIECLDNNFVTPETRIKLKPNYNSIKDFAYYGSAVDLINGSINNIIMKFPAELYFSSTPKTIKYNNETIKCYIIENDFDIDIHSLNVNENNVSNPMRYFSLRYYEYMLNNKSGTQTAISSWSSTPLADISCQDNMNGIVAATVIITINNINYNLYVYLLNDEYTLLYKQSDNVLNGCSLRPNNKIVEEYYNNIDDFEEILINRSSKPLYKATFETPYETENGIKTKYVDYIWPNSNNWNPVLKTSSFKMYYNELMEVALFHDTYDSDNIWRSMTHEAIKNLDWTFIRKTEDTIEDMSMIDNTKISKLLKLYGRQYDDIKQYIDNIKNSNTISYNQKNNIPDYCLTDICDLSGWEILNLNISDDNILRTPSLYNGVINGYNASDANTTFLRNLKINSKYILSKKGTRSAIDIIMRLFGFSDDEYSIKEYVNVAQGKTNGYDRFDGGNKNRNICYPLADDIKLINNERNDGLFNMINTNPYYKLPVREVSVLMGTSYVSYIIPWFTNGVDYDNNLYFQMYGGWGKQDNKYIDLEIAPNIKSITSDNKLTLYDETETYLKYARTVEDMRNMGNLIVKTGDICYVTDINNISTLYNFKNETEKNNINNFSHYFILENDDLSSYIGYHNNEKLYGWKNILISEIENGNTTNGKKVLYLESIISKTTGNNPHTGKGNYDNGQAYLNGMANIFDYALNNNLFTTFSDSQCEKIKKYNFTLKEYEDNRKSWYFTDTSNYSGLHQMTQVNGKYQKLQNETISLNVSGIDYINDIRKSNIIPYNPEKGTINDEAAANSIINTKRMVIEFTPKYYDIIGEQTKAFIINRVLPYIKQVIPSTTIFEYKI